MMDNSKMELNKAVKEVGEMKETGDFKKYIDEIYFPFYKNFVQFSKITFEYPLTVIVGKNGSGKSSILHALYGCPLNNTPSKYWFSSATDPIQDGNGKNMSQSFVYSYHDSGIYNQVIMKRSSRPGTKTKRRDPDYWETDKPRKKYRMQIMKRCPPIEWNNLYIDFRQELSAYDKFFYFGDISGLKSATKQEFVRAVSPQLQRALDDNEKIYRVNGREQNQKSVTLSNEELHFISKILGVRYVAGKLIRHHFYRNWGDTALVTKNDLSYTEAHAGSGEFAVISLVHQLSLLKKNDSRLIILDEPETSLYPGAQQRLLEYLLKIIKDTRSQIVISTHSEKFISSLPDCAVKAIRYNDDLRETEIIDGCSPTSVFSELEVTRTGKCVVTVEDRAAQILVNTVVQSKEEFQRILVRDLSISANSIIKQNILASSEREQWDDYYILDGDQKPDNVMDVDSLTEAQSNDLSFVTPAVERISKKISFPSSKPRGTNSDNLSNDPIKLNAMKKYLRFFKGHVQFLPEATPEDVICDENTLKQYIKLAGSSVALDANEKKKTLYNIASAEANTDNANSQQYYNLFQRLCTSWVKRSVCANAPESNSYQAILNSIININTQFENAHR
ncbi:ATP-dependent nuclease [Lacticaseibacillus paracasei]|uniref:ATP-dependent nuclease n=1 Tax=Lacticaseibacillus paracasei TaxID=1597 RepID=UPI00160CD9DF|nr:ATP-binding protein [Lacticaseibacillus paracasei]